MNTMQIQHKVMRRLNVMHTSVAHCINTITQTREIQLCNYWHFPHFAILNLLCYGKYSQPLTSWTFSLSKHWITVEKNYSPTCINRPIVSKYSTNRLIKKKNSTTTIDFIRIHCCSLNISLTLLNNLDVDHLCLFTVWQEILIQTPGGHN